MIYEKWGAYGNAERRTQHWKQQVLPVGAAMSDTWQILEFAKRFKLKEVWKEQKVDNKLTLPSYLPIKKQKALIQTMPSQKALIIPMLKVMREKFKAVMEKNLQAMAFSFKNIFGKNIVNLA